MSLKVLRIGPACTIQDRGRTGYLALGLSRSGAADVLALFEGAALLEQDANCAALEMAGMGGTFEATQTVRIALTGAPMQANIDGSPIVWNASHVLEQGQTLTIGAAEKGNYGYLHVGGGFATEPFLGSRSTHLTANIGRAIVAGDILPTQPASSNENKKLRAEDRFSGGTLRVISSFQTDLFDTPTLDRFAATDFSRGARANRMGMQLESEGEGFAAKGQLNILSEVITPGDIQMTGTGNPFILLPECQTTGGYPRIATVLPCDLPRAAQTPAGGTLRFEFVTIEQAEALQTAFQSVLGRLPGQTEPLVRDPHDIPDLLSYQLISGMISANE